MTDPMILVASESELPAGSRVWGTGGWLPPENREALDWLTFARLSGWGVTVIRPKAADLEAVDFSGRRWLVLACDPRELGEEWFKVLASKLKSEPILVILREVTAERINGKSLRWIGPGAKCEWQCRKPFEASPVEVSAAASVWATLEGAPIISARQSGCGTVATLGFHPSAARDADGAITSLLRHLLIWGANAPVAWLDWQGTMILRMDDPGGAQNIHYRDWRYPKLGETEWAAIGADLKRRTARLSIGYVSGWVDDGASGELQVGGQAPARVAGQVHPSPLVKYREGGTTHDYVAEFHGIQALRAAGLAEVELHGYTHMHPDTLSWAAALDRCDSVKWYRELGETATTTIDSLPLLKHPLALGIAALQQYFVTRPSTLICPGDEWTNAVLERALELGLSLVSSYYLALRDGDRFCWSQQVCAPYLDQPSAEWFDAGLPVVGYFHDREPALEGVGWISRHLDHWQDARATRFVDFREFAGAVGRRLHLEEHDGGLLLNVVNENAPPLTRPLTVIIRVPGSRLPSTVSVRLDEKHLSLEIRPLNDGLGQVSLPCSLDATVLRQDSPTQA